MWDMAGMWDVEWQREDYWFLSVVSAALPPSSDRVKLRAKVAADGRRGYSVVARVQFCKSGQG